MTLEQDWVRLKNAFVEATKNDNPVFGAYPQELRKADNRGIDFILRRLLASEKYSQRIRLYGGPSSTLAQNPFVDSKGFKFCVIRIKPEFLDNSLHSKNMEPEK